MSLISFTQSHTHSYKSFFIRMSTLSNIWGGENPQRHQRNLKKKKKKEEVKRKVMTD